MVAHPARTLHRPRFAAFSKNVVRWSMMSIIVASVWIRDARRREPIDTPVGAFADAGVKIIGPASPSGWIVKTTQGDAAGRVVRTRPEAASVTGYRGWTEAVLWVDDVGIVRGADLWDSQDTEEHVQAIVEDERFWSQFKGLAADARRWPKLDGVSGATLTSSAMIEGMRRRMGGTELASAVFPEVLGTGEVADFLGIDPGNVVIENDWTARVLAGSSKFPDTVVLRTGPLADDLVGYQGPTELLLAFGDDRLQKASIRHSYDNQPYVGYIPTEAAFWATFEGQTLVGLSAMNLEAAGVEGVSGATMTSMAIADTIVRSTDRWLFADATSREPALHQRMVAWAKDSTSLGDVMCLGMLPVIAIASRMGWWRRRRVRVGYLLAAFVVFGFWSGNLLTLSLVSGWAVSGIPWRLAPVLSVVFIVAVVAPVSRRGNPYCNHMCPHGAVQQLIRPTRSKRWRIPPRAAKGLAWVPGVVAVVAVSLWLWRPRQTDFANWEPFHAYLWPIGGWIAVAMAVGSLILSRRVPMAYCRYGCATGRLIEITRRRGDDGRWRRSDAVLLVLATFAFGLLISQ